MKKFNFDFKSLKKGFAIGMRFVLKAYATKVFWLLCTFSTTLI